jgi:hypothetical protein
MTTTPGDRLPRAHEPRGSTGGHELSRPAGRQEVDVDGA